uniref:Fungal-type protein kinase domain-containing protein n=1 Tax=Psilocybe cubensis TaxID=181762 RepID=A0A8H7Y1F4_PSICU
MLSPEAAKLLSTPSIDTRVATAMKGNENYASQDIKRFKIDEYLLYLNNGVENIQKLESLKKRPLEELQSKTTFIENANEISKHIQETQRYPALLEFRKVANRRQSGYFRKTASKPGVIAAFTSENSSEPIGWQCPDRVFGWPFIQLIGDIASESCDIEVIKNQIAQDLHYMVLARPDLYVSHALLIEDSRITFLCAVTGEGIFDVQLDYTDPNFQPLLFALISHIYDYGRFKDERYTITYNAESRQSEYTLKFETAPGLTQWETFHLIYSSSPFGTTTYVFAAPDESNPIMVNGQRLRVVKDQYCYRMARFSEPDILKHVRGTPGVVTLAYDEEWEPLVPTATRRVKRRLGFVEQGDPFMNIRTVREMLEIAYDLLEVTRYLRFKRHVLHCDLSNANIVVDRAPTTPATNEYVNIQYNDINEHDIVFIKHLLGERFGSQENFGNHSNRINDSNSPLQTHVLLIDFNLAERLDSTARQSEIKKKGTHPFMARAVENEEPYPDLSTRMFTPFTALPQAPSMYKKLHPERTTRFDSEKLGLYILKEAPGDLRSDRVWRHELYHEAESIFWIIVYWLLRANPEPGTELSKETIPLPIWVSLLESAYSRNIVIFSFQQSAKYCARNIHSKLLPVLELVKTLAWAVYPGPYFLPDDNPRTQPDYLHEVFQRAILDFILTNKNEEFMNLEINVLNPRHHDDYKPEELSSTSHLTPSEPYRSLSSAEDEQSAPVNDALQKFRYEGDGSDLEVA